MSSSNQICSFPQCENLAAFKTRKHPAFCLSHITEIFSASGLELLEEFEKPDDYYLARCLTCGEQLHYRFKYLLDSKGYPTKKKVCHVCHWRKWYVEGDLIGAVGNRHQLTREQAESYARDKGAELLKILAGPVLGEEIYITRCLTCGLLQAERYPSNHDKCRPLKESLVTSNPVHGSNSAIARKSEPEKTFEITANQKLGAREFQPDNHLAFLDDLSWWDFEHNDNKQLFSLTPASRKTVYAICPRCSSSFTAPVFNLFLPHSTQYVGICDDCAKEQYNEHKQRWEHYKTTVVADYPNLLACWDDEASPYLTVVASHVRRKWICPNGHHPFQTAVSFLEDGCMVCANLDTTAYNKQMDKQTRIPPIVPCELADQWHPTKNKKYEFGNIHISIKRKVWWQCDHCGYEWEESVRDRTRIHTYGSWDAWHEPYCRCPECGGTLDSLAWHYPSLAAEWSKSNPQSAWDIRPNSKTLGYIPEWVCSYGHAWNMPLASRVRGASCPECQEAGKSKIELSYYKAAKKLWPHAAVKSGVIVRSELFSRSWSVDIYVASHRSFIIEYDGVYWHASKTETDTRKTLELLSAGYTVIRLREQGLASLKINNPSYHEFEVLATGADRDYVLSKIAQLMDMNDY